MLDEKSYSTVKPKQSSFTSSYLETGPTSRPKSQFNVAFARHHLTDVVNLMDEDVVYDYYCHVLEVFEKTRWRK